MKQVYYLCRENDKEYLLTEEALKILRDVVYSKIIKVTVSDEGLFKDSHIKEVWYVDAERRVQGCCGLYCTIYIPVWEEQILRVPNPNFREEFRQGMFSRESVIPIRCVEVGLSMENFRKEYKNIEVIQ